MLKKLHTKKKCLNKIRPVKLLSPAATPNGGLCNQQCPYVLFLANKISHEQLQRMLSNLVTANIRGIRRPQLILVTLTLFSRSSQYFYCFHVLFLVNAISHEWFQLMLSNLNRAYNRGIQ